MVRKCCATVTSRGAVSFIKEVLVRPIRLLCSATIVLAAFSATGASAASSPYPATLMMHPGLTESAAGQGLPWGTRLSATQARWVTFKSNGPTFRWGVWKDGVGPAISPVRSTDGGRHWSAAGPQLATDWVGGGIYFVNRVLPESMTGVVMVSDAVIDLTTDGGRYWYQFVNIADNWSISAHGAIGGGIELRISPASYSSLPRSSFAIYLLEVARHRWRRTVQSVH